ncbi:MAG: hypothetical protein GXP42_15525 [Chloroflexi bacterium]|nr:hypothetical protein [Chloroflexota bacterium]
MSNSVLLAKPMIQHASAVQKHIDPLKNGGLDILSALINSPSTTKQLAIRFGLPRARVQFAIDGLLENGFVYVYKEIQEGDALEIYYAAAAQDIELTLNERSPRQARILGAQIILDSLHTNFIKALSNAPEEHKHAFIATLRLVQCRMNSEKAARFVAELEDLVARFNEAEDLDAEDEFALCVALYPIFELS